MKKIIALQITLLILFSGALGGMLFSTDIDVYDDVYDKIVTVLCLSCAKLKPITIKEYRFETANNKPHPDFIIENLSKGPVILDYSITFCPPCIPLEQNILSKVFNYNYDPDNPESYIFLNRQFKDTNVTFIHLTTDDDEVIPEDGELFNSRYVYDITGDGGNPMLVFITYGYNHGFIEPYYSTLYGLEAKTDDGQREEFRDLINESIDFYNEYKEAVD